MQSTCRGQTYLVAPIPKEMLLSYESRKKKRAYKRIEAKAKQRRTPESARRWFLTLAKKPGRFYCCGKRFDRGGEIRVPLRAEVGALCRMRGRGPGVEGLHPLDSLGASFPALLFTTSFQAWRDRVCRVGIPTKGRD